MNELLSNPAVQTALVLAIVTGLNALVAWLKQKFPTQSARVESNWCYLQPVVEYAMACAKNAAATSGGTAVVLDGIVSRSLAEFSASYRKLEGKDVPAADLVAARNEITAAVLRVTGG